MRTRTIDPEDAQNLGWYGENVHTMRTVVEAPHCTVRAVGCRADLTGWSDPEEATSTQLVLVLQGRFRIQIDGRRSTLDSTTGYIHRTGDEVSFAHPAGGDVCTSITIPSDFATTTIGEGASAAVRVDSRLELAHRLLLRSGDDPDYTATEAIIALLQLTLRHQPNESSPPGRYELADSAREAMLANEQQATSLIGLADLLQTTPAHLSRTFRHHIGMSLSRYRNRVRISRALECLSNGETDLADLAAMVGFSDQSHLTRTMHREIGSTPTRIRRLFETPDPRR